MNSDTIQKIEQFANFDKFLILFGREKSLFYLVGGSLYKSRISTTINHQYLNILGDGRQSIFNGVLYTH